MNRPNDNKRILAIDLRSRSFGFAVFEGPTRLLDWGAKSFRGGVNAAKIPASEKFAALLDEFSPSIVVLRKPGRHSEKKAAMFKVFFEQAQKRLIPIRQVFLREVKSVFPGCNRNKYTIAEALAKQFTELSPRLPGARKIWQSEDYRMSIFDAAALGVGYFGHRTQPAERFNSP